MKTSKKSGPLPEGLEMGDQVQLVLEETHREMNRS